MDDQLLQQLRKSQDAELNLRNALDVGSIGHWSWIEGEPMQWDGHMLRLFGIGREEIPKDLNGLLYLLDQASQELTIESFQAAINKNAGFDVFVRADKSGFDLRLIGRPFFQPGAKGPAISGLCMHAPTGQTEGNKQESAATDQSKELANFASVASHDLREPLRMITSYLTLLQERTPEALDDRARRYIQYACEGADRMRSLIEDLLSFSRMDNELEPPRAIALAETINEALNILSTTIRERKAEVTVEIEEPAIVLGDRTSLVRLFQNLISNAIKFHDAESTPRVELCLEDGDQGSAPGFWLVSVRDHGIGIEPEHHELLFSLFQRLHTRDEFEGSGIGLAICKKIIERLGGRITIQSVRGTGSTFKVHLKKAGE